MLSLANRLLSYFDLAVSRTTPASLKYSKPNLKLVALSSVLYALLGWCSLLLFSVNHDLGQRAAQCALGVAASPRAAWLFIIALVVYLLYLLRPEVDKISIGVPKRGKRLIWRYAMFLAYIWSGLFLAVGATLFGISLHLVWLEQSPPTILLAIYGAMTFFVGVAYKTQAPEVLWRIRRARKNPLTNVVLPLGCIMVLLILILVSTLTSFPGNLSAPTTAPCPQVQLHWR